jgi:G3E family GTPase
MADALVVTKTDLRAAHDARDIIAAATAIAPDLVLHDAQEPDFSLARLFSRPDGEITSRKSTSFTATEVPQHDRDVGSFTLALPERIDWPAFTLWLSALLHRHGDRILRVKGLVRTSAGDNPVVIHGVQHSMHPPVHLAEADSGQPSFLVFITRGLTRDPIAQSLTRFLHVAAARVERSQAR